MTSRPRVTLGCGRCGACIPCRLLKRDPARYAARILFSGETAPAPPSRVELPCVHEGAIVEPCKSCDLARGELRHVRQCCHPTADRDFCTRAFVSVAVQACETCPDRVTTP